jgi:hypothetical protein
MIHKPHKIVERRCGDSGDDAVGETDGDAMNLMGSERHGENGVSEAAAGGSGADDGPVNLNIEGCICAAGVLVELIARRWLSRPAERGSRTAKGRRE